MGGVVAHVILVSAQLDLLILGLLLVWDWDWVGLGLGLGLGLDNCQESYSRK